ncbi:MAG: hypothetical protein ACJ79H_00765 [Myxococcales bacterium]
MRTKLGLLSGVLSVVLASHPAAARVLTVKLTAHVTWVDDPANVLGGQAFVGQSGEGTYGYETTAPDQDPGPIDGSYPQSPSQGSASLTVGPFTFASDSTSPGWMYRALVHAPLDPYYQDFLRLTSIANQPLANGASVATLEIEFSDFSGAALSSDALLATAPDLASFPQSTVFVAGSSATGNWYTIRLQIDSAVVAGPELAVSPSSSSFVRLQHVDPALFMGAGSQIVAVQGSVNGVPLPAQYLGQCAFAPPNAQNRPAIVCPDINQFLFPGANRVAWRAELIGGSTLTGSVDWEMIQ